MAFMNNFSPNTGFQPPSFVTNIKIFSVTESQLEWSSAGEELTMHQVLPSVTAWEDFMALFAIQNEKFVSLIHHFKVVKKTSGDQLRVDNPKLPKAFPQTLQRSTWKPIPFSRFKTQHQRDFIMFMFSKGFSSCSSHSQCINACAGGAVKGMLCSVHSSLQWQPGGHWLGDTSTNHC